MLLSRRPILVLPTEASSVCVPCPAGSRLLRLFATHPLRTSLSRALLLARCRMEWTARPDRPMILPISGADSSSAQLNISTSNSRLERTFASSATCRWAATRAESTSAMSPSAAIWATASMGICEAVGTELRRRLVRSSSWTLRRVMPNSQAERLDRPGLNRAMLRMASSRARMVTSSAAAPSPTNQACANRLTFGPKHSHSRVIASGAALRRPRSRSSYGGSDGKCLVSPGSGSTATAALCMEGWHNATP